MMNKILVSQNRLISAVLALTFLLFLPIVSSAA